MGSDLSLLELEIEAAKDAIHGLRSTVIALRAENARLRAALLRLADDDSDEAYAARAALDAKEVDGG